mgnify:CR=1 FL=1
MAQASSYIDASQRIDGVINASEDLVLAGHVVGTLESSHKVVVTTEGMVEGDISARSVEVHGVVVGQISALDDILISRQAQVQGSIKARRLHVEPGARIDADVSSGEETAPSRSTRRSATRRPASRPSLSRRDVTREVRTIERTPSPPPTEEIAAPKPAKKATKKPTKKATKTRSKRSAKPKSEDLPTKAEFVEITESETVEDRA